MTNIFISYNRKSEAVTKALADDLEALGHTVWFDQELSGGQAWWDQILAKVRGCDLFVFILEPEALNSTACKREYDYAVDVGKPVLPVLVSDGVPVNRLPPKLSQIQYVDYRKQDRQAAFSLARALGAVPPPKPLPDPLPPSPEAPISYLGSLTEKVETTSSLTYEQQSALVFDLKRSLRDLGDADDARALLEKLRTRRDLFSAFAEEIDEVLGGGRRASAAPVRASGTTTPSPKKSPTEHSLSVAAEHEPPEEKEAQHPSVRSSQIDAERKPAWREKVKAACLVGLLGAAAGILCVTLFQLIRATRYDFFSNYILEEIFPLFPISGAIVGAISGMNRSRIKAALVGMVVAAIIVGCSRSVPWGGRLERLFVLLLPPLTVLIAEFIKRQKAQ